NEALDAMLRYDWPGNIRELKNCIERMMAFNSGPLLHFDDLPTSIAFDARQRGAAQAAVVNGPSAPPVPAPVILNGIVPLGELERIAIRHAIEHTKGDRTTAAQLLGIGRTTLYRKLKEYRLE